MRRRGSRIHVSGFDQEMDPTQSLDLDSVGTLNCTSLYLAFFGSAQQTFANISRKENSCLVFLCSFCSNMRDFSLKLILVSCRNPHSPAIPLEVHRDQFTICLSLLNITEGPFDSWTSKCVSNPLSTLSHCGGP